MANSLINLFKLINSWISKPLITAQTRSLKKAQHMRDKWNLNAWMPRVLDPLARVSRNMIKLWRVFLHSVWHELCSCARARKPKTVWKHSDVLGWEQALATIHNGWERKQELQGPWSQNLAWMVPHGSPWARTKSARSHALQEGFYRWFENVWFCVWHFWPRWGFGR